MLDFGRFLNFSRKHNFKDEARRKLTFVDHYRPHQGIGNLQAAFGGATIIWSVRHNSIALFVLIQFPFDS